MNGPVETALDRAVHFALLGGLDCTAPRPGSRRSTRLNQPSVRTSSTVEVRVQVVKTGAVADPSRSSFT